MMNIKRRIIKAICLFVNNPWLFFKLLIACLHYKIGSRWFLPKSPVQKRVNGVLFEFDFNLDPKNIKEMYFGYYEPEVIEVMKNALRSGDVFIDVGASIGYLSAIGAGFVGNSGQVHSFEPVPQYFEELKKMSMLNPDYHIIANQCALGENEGKVNIDVTNLPNIGWATTVPGYMRRETVKETLEVPVYRLDNYIRQKGLNNISLIKIDVEGFEFPVLKGISGYFEYSNHRPLIICEIAPPAYSLSGHTLTQLLEYMKKYSYNAYNFFNPCEKVDITKLKEITHLMFKPS